MLHAAVVCHLFKVFRPKFVTANSDGFFDVSASCNSQSKIYNLTVFSGVLAQLVERLNGIEEVTGSNPVGSTSFGNGFAIGQSANGR